MMIWQTLFILFEVHDFLLKYQPVVMGAGSDSRVARAEGRRGNKCFWRAVPSSCTPQQARVMAPVQLWVDHMTQLGYT